MNKLVITPREEKDVTMTIRIDRALQEKYNELSAKTNRSRNELIGMALQYALENMEIKEWKLENSKAENTTLLFLYLLTRQMYK